jgi:hypothetical protein
MTSLLSSISGQFGKSVILGALFPVLILSILNVVLVAPIVPALSAIQERLAKVAVGEEKWTAVTLGFVVLVVTGLLFNLNIPIIRLYEGYPWQNSWVGAFLARRQKRRFAAAVPLRLALRYLRRELDALGRHGPETALLGDQQTRLAQLINSGFPDREDLVLPTRLGNVIRNFERYPWVAYGMESIVLWPRLIAKIEGSFAATVDDTKASFDFMLNCSFLSALTTVGIVVIGLFHPAPFTVVSMVPWLWRALLFTALAVVFYRFSVGRAAAWGTQVMAAFDLYRLDLLKALGYQQQPQTAFEEQVLWQRISVQLLYPDTIKDASLGYRSPPTRLVASPAGVRVEVTRRLHQIDLNGHIQVQLTLRHDNVGTAARIVLAETLPEGYRYVWESAQGPRGPLRVSNLNPVELEVPDVPAGQGLAVTYEIQRAG